MLQAEPKSGATMLPHTSSEKQNHNGAKQLGMKKVRGKIPALASGKRSSQYAEGAERPPQNPFSQTFLWGCFYHDPTPGRATCPGRCWMIICWNNCTGGELSHCRKWNQDQQAHRNRIKRISTMSELATSVILYKRFWLVIIESNNVTHTPN